MGTKASCLVDVFKEGDEFVFELGGRVLRENFVCVSVL